MDSEPNRLASRFFMEVVQMLFRRQKLSGGSEGHRGLRALSMVLLGAALLLGLVLGLAACTFESGPDQTPTTSSPITTEAADSGVSATTESTEAGETITTSPPTTAGQSGPSGILPDSPAVSVAETLGPSVVNIVQPSGEGSGVIYRSDGMIITNNHVVIDSFENPVEELEVTLATGEKLSATVLGRDPLTDLAVIQVEGAGTLPAANFQTDDPAVGQYAIAIGSPLGFENSVTMGIVSGIARSIEGLPGAEGVALTNLIQTDAPISPGNSGGALADAEGNVIGINVAYLPPAQTGAVSLGFAIPAVVATRVADEIIDTGRATHAYMGVATRMVTPEMQQQFGLSRSSGILIAEVFPGSPAEAAGIQQGDIVVEVDGEEMVDSSDLLIAVRDLKPGDQVDVLVDRDGREMTITVTLEERPADF